MRLFNLGGGFGIPYFPGEQPLTLAPIGDNLRELLPKIQAALPDAKVALELGRYLVGESGVYVCSIIDKKVSRGHMFLVTDGGLHHHLAASGNFGQVMRKNYPVLVANRIDSGRDARARPSSARSARRSTCWPIGWISRQPRSATWWPSSSPARTASRASPRGFLSHPEPAEVVL